MPSDMPADRASSWAEASCCSSSHCSQQWKSTSLACRSRNVATAALEGSCSSSAHCVQGMPYSSTSAHQVA